MPNKKSATVHEVQMVNADLIDEHPKNTNKQTRAVFNKLRESIREEGFDETLLLVPREDKPGRFYVISGNHRFRAGKAEGIDEFPAVVHEWNEVKARTELVRRNVGRGAIDNNLLSREIEALAAQENAEIDVIAEKMGFADAEVFADVYKPKVEREAPAHDAAKRAESAPAVKMIDDLGMVVSAIIEQHGDTVPCSYIVFPVGGKRHMMVATNAGLKKVIEQISNRAFQSQMDINILLTGLLKIGMFHTNFDGDLDKDRVVSEGDDNDGDADF